MKYKFSIIIPVYNLESLIERTLDSISTQTLNPSLYEVIITDDQSKDRTFEIIRSYKKIANIKILQNEVNSGPGIARNKSISYAEGEYLLFLDGDDFFVPNTLENLNSFLNEYPYDMVTYNWAFSSDPKAKKNIYLKNTLPSERIERLENFLAGNMDGSVIFSTIKTEVIKNNNLIFPNGFHEDISFYCWMNFYSRTIGILDEILYVKDDRAGSIVNTISEKHLKGFLNSWPLTLDKVLSDTRDLDFKYFSSSYYRGINGMISGALKKIYQSRDDASKCSNYEFVFSVLQQDRYIDINYLASFSNVTKKDKLANYFLSLYVSSDKSFHEKCNLLDEYLAENL